MLSILSVHRVAKIWRKGPVLIAGDAAHLTPPFMGQGMCTGIRDAANLAWKLVKALNGGDEEMLFDSYQDERKPHARSYVETAVRLGGLINSLDRESALQLADSSRSGAMRSIAPKLGQSALLQVQTNNPYVGRPFPQVHLDTDGQRLDDACWTQAPFLSAAPHCRNAAMMLSHLMRVITPSWTPCSQILEQTPSGCDPTGTSRLSRKPSWNFQNKPCPFLSRKKRKIDMKLASLKSGGRDGSLVVVSKDLTKMASATSVAQTLQPSARNLGKFSHSAERDLGLGRAR